MEPSEDFVDGRLTTATTVTVSNMHGVVLVDRVLCARGIHARCLDPNWYREVSFGQSLIAESIAQEIARLMGYTHPLVGWGIEQDLASLGIALPQLQVFDLSTDPMVIESLKMLPLQAPIAPNTMQLLLPWVVLELSSKKMNIRQQGRRSFRHPIIDNMAVAALWAHFGEALMARRQAPAALQGTRAQSYAGAGLTLEEHYSLSKNRDALIEVGRNPLRDQGRDMGPARDYIEISHMAFSKTPKDPQSTGGALFEATNARILETAFMQIEYLKKGLAKYPQ